VAVFFVEALLLAIRYVNISNTDSQVSSNVGIPG